MPTLPSTFNVWARGAACGAAVVGAVWVWAASRQPAAVRAETTQTKEVVREVVRVEWRDRVVVKTEDRVRVVVRKVRETRKDGTVVETETKVQEERKRDSAERDSRTVVGETVESERTSSNTSVASLRRYHLHVGYAPLHRDSSDVAVLGCCSRQQFQLGAAARVGDLPFFVGATAQMPGSGVLPNVYVGVTYEW